MALFEVVSRTKDKARKAPLSVPDWMKQPAGDMDGLEVLPEPPPTPEPPAMPELPAAAADPDVDGVDEVGAYVTVEPVSVSAPVQPVRPHRYETPDETPDETSGADAEDDGPCGLDASAGGVGEPVLSIAGRRVTLSLNYVSCVVVGMGVVLALLVAFALGRLSVDRVPRPAEGPQSARPQAGPDADKGPSPGAAPPGPRRISGKQYLVISQMDGRTAAHRAAAEKIVAYCQAVRGDRATVVDDGRQYMVLSGVPFGSGTSSEALVYAADMHNLGLRYKTDEDGRFDFNQLDSQGGLAPRFETEP